MTSRLAFMLRLAAAATILAGVGASAQQATPAMDELAETRAALSQAHAQGQAAQARAEQLETQATRIAEAAERTGREVAALAARIQQAEADIAGQEATMRLIERQRRDLRARLAERQRPLVRLTAALQRLSRRPPVLALLRPGSVRDTMYTRALIATMLPEMERRTAALRAEIRRGHALQAQARLAGKRLREGESMLLARRQMLITLEARQRLESRQATGIADREAERALALAEQARDLGTLMEDLREAGSLRERLAKLPGPVPRPARPADALVIASEPAETAPPVLGAYLLPVAGRVVAGFGDATPGQPRSRGIMLATRAAAQVVAPGAGRVVFAGPYRGYGNIVIVEHGGGWTSLVTGLARLDARVGDTMVAGSPIGIAGPGNPRIAVELRREGVPVNPLQYLRAL